MYDRLVVRLPPPRVMGHGRDVYRPKNGRKKLKYTFFFCQFSCIWMKKLTPTTSVRVTPEVPNSVEPALLSRLRPGTLWLSIFEAGNSELTGCLLVVPCCFNFSCCRVASTNESLHICKARCENRTLVYLSSSLASSWIGFKQPIPQQHSSIDYSLPHKRVGWARTQTKMTSSIKRDLPTSLWRHVKMDCGLSLMFEVNVSHPALKMEDFFHLATCWYPPQS